MAFLIHKFLKPKKGNFHLSIYWNPPDLWVKSADTGHRALNRTPRNRTPDTGHWTPDNRHQTSAIGHETIDTAESDRAPGHQTSDNKQQSPEIVTSDIGYKRK